MSFVEETMTYTFQASTNGEVTYTITAPIEDIGVGYRVATFVTSKKTFHTHARDEVRNSFLRTSINITLGDDEYFLMGDNWSSSSDSFTHISSLERVTLNLIQGKMVAIQGTAKIKDGVLYDKQKIKEMYYF